MPINPGSRVEWHPSSRGLAPDPMGARGLAPNPSGARGLAPDLSGARGLAPNPSGARGLAPNPSGARGLASKPLAPTKKTYVVWGGGGLKTLYFMLEKPYSSPAY